MLKCIFGRTVEMGVRIVTTSIYVLILSSQIFYNLMEDLEASENLDIGIIPKC